MTKVLLLIGLTISGCCIGPKLLGETSTSQVIVPRFVARSLGYDKWVVVDSQHNTTVETFVGPDAQRLATAEASRLSKVDNPDDPRR